jgi:molecular chaperone HscB
VAAGIRSPFETLGILPQYGIDLPAVEKTHRELSRALHPDRYASSSPSERRAALTKAADVNEAWRIVRDPIRRAEALLSLRGVAVGEDKEPKADPMLLMEMMEAREAMADPKQRDTLGTQMHSREEKVKAELAAMLDSEKNDAALKKLGELRFIRRILQELDDAV